MGEHIEKIFEREREVKAAMMAGKAVIDIPPQFRLEQMGLVPVYADSYGQLWIIVGDRLVLASDHRGAGIDYANPGVNGWLDK